MTFGNPLSQPCRTGQHGSCHWDACACPHHEAERSVHLPSAECPLRCGWWTPQQVLQLELDPARERLQPATDRILQHLATEHRRELLFMVAGMEGGHGEPLVVNLMQSIDARQVQDAADVVMAVLVPQMRARLARDLALKKLRPVDPWPAVRLSRYVWTTAPEYAGSMNGTGEHPPGMRPLTEYELEDGRAPDLYTLELRTEAVPDTRQLEL